MTTAELIDRLLEEKGWSRRYLAKVSGIPPSTLQSAMERGGNLTADKLVKLADALGVSVVELMGSDGNVEFVNNDSGKSVTLRPFNTEATQKYLAWKRYKSEIAENVDGVNFEGVKKIAEYSRDIRGNPKYQKKKQAEQDNE